MSKELKKDGLPKLQTRYARRSREGKSRMLDELCQDYEYERKYAIKLLGGGVPAPTGRVHPGAEQQYEVVEPVARKIWLTAEQPCGKRLAPVLRQWPPYYEERYGELSARQRKRPKQSTSPSMRRRSSKRLAMMANGFCRPTWRTNPKSSRQPTRNCGWSRTCSAR